MRVIPKIRFKGFTDNWEQRKLGDVANYRRGSFPQPYGKSEWYDGEGAMPFVQVADVSDDMNLVKDTKQKISRLAQPMSVFAEEKSVLVTLQGSIGRVAIAQYCAFVDRTVLIFESYNEEIDNTFWAYIIKQKFIDEARKAPGGTIKTITKEALSDFDLLIPVYQEQKKIGVCFKNIDHLITLHQCKCDEVKELKKYMLQKMFPKKGKKVPEIRFEGFIDAWEQRKLDDICGQLTNTVNPTDFPDNYYMEYSMPAFDNYKTADYVVGESMNSIRKIMEKPCLLVNKLNVRKKRIWHVENPEKNAVCSAEFVPLYSMGSDLKFLKYVLLTDNFTNYLEECSSGSSNSQKRVTPDVIMKAKITIPSFDEQQKIGKYFHNLDHLITLHQRKCDSLKELKKYMLQNMFPKEG